MKYLSKILKWLWSAITLLVPLTPTLFGASLYVGIAGSLYAIFIGTRNLLSEFYVVYSEWSAPFANTIIQAFNDVTTNTFFQFLGYVLSLDVPLDFLRSNIIRLTQFGFCLISTLVVATELVVMALGVYWVRKRVGKVLTGLGGGSSTGEI